MAVKNGAPSLQRCLDSISRQSAVALETLVVDGASTDGTRELLEANVRAGIVSRFVSEPDGGVYEAWNKGIRLSRGRWICFLGCDDEFHDPLALRGSLDAATARAPHEPRVVYGRLNLVTHRNRLAETVGTAWGRARPAVRAGRLIPPPGTLLHRSLFEQHGLFDESYRIAGDYEFLLRELRTRDALFVDRVVVDMRIRGLSARPETIHQALREVARARATHGLRGTPPGLRLRLAASWAGARIHRILGDRLFGVVADLYRVVRGKPRIWTG